ncbi:MAG: ATPase, T2SS/T4P/T4SS family, partial [Patescibacteria group bacterium]
RGDRVVYSNFGSFYTVHYPSKVIIHPKLGLAKKMIMLPTNVAKWMPSENIKSLVRSGETKGSPTLHALKSTNKEVPSGTIVASNNTTRTVRDETPDSDETIVPIRLSSRNAKNIVGAEINPEQKNKNINIYEELMQDGSKEETTFNGAIRVPKDRSKPFWSKLFNRSKDQESSTPTIGHIDNQNKDTQKVSLVDSGVFDPASKPETMAVQATAEQSAGAGLASHPQGETVSVQTNNDQTPIEKPIAPFPSNPMEISYIDLSKAIVPKEILQKIPEKIARHYGVVPVEENDNELVVAMTDPEDIEAKELIKKYAQKPLKVRLGTQADINHVLDQYQGLESEVLEAIEEVNTEEEENNKTDNGKAANLTVADDAPTARIVNSLLRRAIRDKASDVHIEPLENEVQVRFRIDGVLHKKLTLPKDIQLSVSSRIKILSNIKIDEQRLPQDGRFSISIDNRRVDFRVSTLPTAYGEKIVMRILDKASGVLTVEQLGLQGMGLDALTQNLEKSHGMILVTGPTGSGKTTTLYALIDKLFAEGVNIVTLEDPIEYQMPGINQSQVNSNIDYTFASGLRSIVRQDPDIIMIGEIRDMDTAEMAVQAALTGHVVLSTLHTNDAAGAAPRLIDMGVEPFLLTSSVNVIIGQRLARKICDECKEKDAIPEAEIESVKKIIDTMPEKEKKEMSSKELVFYKGKGCKSCDNTGYRGRIGIFEVLSVTETVRDLVLRKVSSGEIQTKAIEDGMVTMIQDGIIKSLEGKTSLEEVWRVTKD